MLTYTAFKSFVVFIEKHRAAFVIADTGAERSKKALGNIARIKAAELLWINVDKA